MVLIIRVRVSQLVGGDSGERCKGEEEKCERDKERETDERWRKKQQVTLEQSVKCYVFVFSVLRSSQRVTINTLSSLSVWVFT